MTPPPTRQGLASPLAAYRDWIVGEALPRWSVTGFDAGAGRFQERLDLAGEPVDVPYRCMVQARQIYVFADAARRGWFDAGAALAETAMASLLRDFRGESGDQAWFAFSVDRAGHVRSDVRDAYAHAFVLFSIAALYRLNGDRRLLEVAEKTLRFVDAEMRDARHGGLHDALPLASGDKRQNPHMHLLEAYLFLERAAPGRGFVERAAGIVALFKDRLFDAGRGCLLEYFGADWSAHADPARAAIWEPGHHFEWAWLLNEYASLTGESPEPWMGTLYEAAVARGFAPSGLVVDEVDARDQSVIKASSRIWPHTEAIKAAAARSANGDGDALPLASRMAERLMTVFLDRPFAGGWIDHVDPAGRPLVDYVPASSLYHLYLAATELPAEAAEPAAAHAEPAF